MDMDSPMLAPNPPPARPGHEVRTKTIITYKDDGKTWDTVEHSYECDCKRWEQWQDNHVPIPVPASLQS